jgi:hypothetical protein
MVTGRQTCVLYDGAEFSISGIRYLPNAPDVSGCPLIIAVHGGGFTAQSTPLLTLFRSEPKQKAKGLINRPAKDSVASSTPPRRGYEQ